MHATNTKTIPGFVVEAAFGERGSASLCHYEGPASWYKQKTVLPITTLTKEEISSFVSVLQHFVALFLKQGVSIRWA